MFVKMKQKLCANVPQGASQQRRYVDKEQFKQMTSNNLQCETDFHAEANSQTKWNMWFVWRRIASRA